MPRLSERPREAALQPLLWVHAFRVAGGAVLAPGAVAAAVPIAFQRLVGYGDLITAALRARLAGAIAVTWTVLVLGNGGHDQRDHPVDALQRVQPRAGR